jgi:MSHA biogenesis protein MshI
MVKMKPTKIFETFKRNGWGALKVRSNRISFAHVERRSGAMPAITTWIDHVYHFDEDAGDAIDVFASEHHLNTRHCIAVLNRAEYQLIQVNAVKVPAAEVKRAVRWGLQKMLDYPVENATVEVLDIPFDSEHPSRPRFMLAIAARNEVIHKCIVRCIDHANMALEAIDIAEIGQRNIAALLEKPDRGLALLSFNDDGGLLTFTAGGELYRSRQFYITANQLRTTDEDRLTAVYERVALDLLRTLDNFNRRFSYVAVDKLLVAPFEMRTEFVNFLKPYLPLEVDTFELSDIFNLEATPQLADVAMQSRAFTVVGIALRGEQT